MQVTPEQYEASLAEMRRLSQARTALGQQIAIGNASPDPATRRATLPLAKDLATIKARIADVQQTIDGYKDALKRRRRILSESHDDLPPDDLRAVAGRTAKVARQTIRDLIVAQGRHPTEREALLMDALKHMTEADGFIHRAETEIADRDAQIAELRADVARQAARTQELNSLAQTALQRRSRAQQILAGLWDDRYDEVDSFRTARGIKYRVHIDDATAKAITEAI